MEYIFVDAVTCDVGKIRTTKDAYFPPIGKHRREIAISGNGSH